jgi:transposase
MKKHPARFVGLDVSQDRLDLACRPADTRGRVANDSSGIAELISQRHQLPPALMVFDATGGWQDAVVAALAVSSRPFVGINPRQLRAVAKAPGPWAKRAALDAGGMAHFAAAVRPTPRPLPDERPQQLDALLQRQRPRRAMWVAERHRVALAHPTVRDSLAQQIAALQRLLHETDEEVAPLIGPADRHAV